MKTAVALSAALALSACASASVPPYVAEEGFDCGVIAAVLRQKYGFGETRRHEPFVSLDSALPRDCDWSQYNMAPPTLYEPSEFPWAPRSALHISRPRYFSGGAVVETSERRGSHVWVQHYELTLSGVMGWIVLPEEWQSAEPPDQRHTIGYP
jgi:hypothetical protein